MNMDLDAATKEAPTLTLDPFAEAKAEIVEKKPEELVEEQASKAGREGRSVWRCRCFVPIP